MPSKRRKRAAVASFRKGVTYRISTKMKEMSSERESKHIVTPTGNDIVLCKEQVREKKFQEQFDFKLRYRKSTSSNISNTAAWGAGYASGDSVNLNRPIENNDNVTLRLGHD